MKVLRAGSIYILVTLFSVILVRADGWRGIKPLRSTRAEVEQLLGQPNEPSKRHSLVYKTQKEVVIIDYTDDYPCKSGNSNGWRVPRGTVLSITVSMRTLMPLSQLGIEEWKYKKTPDIHRADVLTYTNEEDGMSVLVYQGNVQHINFFPSKKDEHLRCHEMQATSDGEIGMVVYPAIDTYHDISFEEEKARLDSFALNLQKQSGMIGYVVTYAGQRDRASKARVRAERAKNYLIHKRGIEAKRIMTKYGGRRKEFTVELGMASPGKRAAALP